MAGGRFAGDWLATRFGSGNVVRAGGGLVVAGVGLALITMTPAVAILAIFGVIIMLLGTHVKGKALAPAQAAVAEA